MAVKQNTSKEAWFRRMPKVNDIKDFGSISYAWIQEEKITKLDPKRNKLMITKDNDNHKSYRLVDLDTNHDLNYFRHRMREEI